MSIEINENVLKKEINQGIVPLGVPAAYKYDVALVESAKALVNASLNQIKNGYGYPFTAATAAAMTDVTKIYVYTGNEVGYTNGNWYYYNGSTWVSGGVYNATALETDKTLTVSGAAADAKVVGDFDKISRWSDATSPYIVKIHSLDGQFYNTSGVLVSDASINSKYTDILPCMPNDIFSYRGKGQYAAVSAIFYDICGVRIGNPQYNSTSGYTYITIPSDCYGVRFSSYATSPEQSILDVKRFPRSDYFGDMPYIDDWERSTPFTAKINYKDDGYLNNKGEYVSDATYCSKFTNIIQCAPNDKFMYKGHYTYGLPSAIFYDKSRAFISYVQVDSPDDYTEITIPNNCYYVLFESLTNAQNNIGEDYVTLDIYKENERLLGIQNIVDSNILFRKKFVACGDSFTYGYNPAYQDQTDLEIYSPEYKCGKSYAYWIAKRNKMNFVNMAHNGYAMSDFMGIYQNIPTDADYLTLAFGLNDYSRGVPIGTVDDDSSDGTFLGYWNTVLTWIYNNMPDCHVGIIIMPAYMGNTYREAMENIANKYGIPYFNLYTDPKAPLFMNKEGVDVTIAAERYNHFRAVSGDNHPSQQCQKFMSTFIENFIREL